MAIADNRQRFMPLPEDRLADRGQTLAYPEAVLLVNPVEPEFKGEVHLPLFSFIIINKNSL
jgi:rhamnogalacturonan endolyase